MARFAPNFHHLFKELPAEQRFASARACGFEAVEWHMPYDLSKQRLRQLLSDNGLIFLYATIPWDSKVGGLGGQPGREDEFKHGADAAIDYAIDVGFRFLQVGHGAIPDGVSQEECFEVYLHNIGYVCDQLADAPVKVVIEPVATAVRNRPFVMSKMSQADEVLRRLDRPNLGLVFDTYHLRMEEEGTLTDLWRRYAKSVRHVQIGNAPTRNEPGVGEIDLHHVIGEVDRGGYDGFIGLEFNPSRDTWSSLHWLNDYGYRIYDSVLRAT